MKRQYLIIAADFWTYMGKIMSLLSSYKGLCYLSAILTGALVIKLWTPQLLLLMGALLMGSAALPANR